MLYFILYPSAFFLRFKMFPTLALSISLFLATGALMAWHWRSWNATRAGAIDAAERDFAWSQFRRRAQATAMMALLAIFMLASLWLEHMAPWVFAMYILVMLALLAWIVILALADMVATRQYFLHTHTKNVAEQARLRAELYLIEEEVKGDRSGGNGKAH